MQNQNKEMTPLEQRLIDSNSMSKPWDEWPKLTKAQLIKELTVKTTELTYLAEVVGWARQHRLDHLDGRLAHHSLDAIAGIMEQTLKAGMLRIQPYPGVGSTHNP